MPANAVGPGFLLMQDNARPHKWLECVSSSCKTKALMLWTGPARSPDLNPIEHIWDIMSQSKMAARSSAAASRAPGVKPPISTFLVGLGLEANFTGLACVNKRVKLLRTPDWRSAARRTEGKRKRCARKQKRGKRGGLLARLKANAGRPPIPSLFLSNVRSLDNKLDLLRLRLGASREMRNCAVLCLTETWLNDNMPDPASSSTAGFSVLLSSRSKAGGLCVYV
ncbi:hypothetical protein L3Q82_007486 [Scortum barcoo]|uniref:Uncharacterized protein n=1 Tax=Scortum barcoo TaxID=214431 RepID=A0ACB8WNP2_9TELE|nr:hypothetical protein L3Q82_007486 [Scortum barcoo]